MSCNCVLIGRVPAFWEVFQKAAEVSDGRIKIVKQIEDIEAKSDEQILAEINSCGDIAWVVIDPIGYYKGKAINLTRLIEQIRRQRPQALILAIASNEHYVSGFFKKGANLFRAYSEISIREIDDIASSLINHPPRQQFIFTRLVLLPKQCKIELIGQTELSETAPQIVEIKYYPTMRLIYFLALERYQDDHSWLTLVQRAVGRTVERYYRCLQPAVWDALEEALDRKPRGQNGSDLVDCDYLKQLENLINQPRTKMAAPKIISPQELSQKASFANADVTSSLSNYQFEKLIVGPKQGKSTYMLHESISAKNIFFDLCR
jgi:hypothetical protein